MSSYHLQEASFEVPEGSFDRTLTRLEITAPDGDLVLVLVERTPYPEGYTLAEVVQHHTAEAHKHMRLHAPLFLRERRVGGLSAFDGAASWRSEDGEAYTRQAHLAIGQTWLIVTCELELPRRAVADDLMEWVLTSFRVRGDGPAGVYAMNDASFDLPEARVVDRSIARIDVKAPSGRDIDVLVEGKPVPARGTLADAVAALTLGAATRLPAFKVLDERERVVDGAEAIEQTLRWRVADGVVYVRQANVALATSWLIVVVEGDIADRGACDLVMDALLASFKILQSGGSDG